MKKIILLLLVFVSTKMHAAPVPVSNVSLPTNGSSSSTLAPQDTLKYQRQFYLVTPDEMRKAGFQNGMSINSIGFTNAVAPDSITKGKFKVYLQNTLDKISRKDTNWTELISSSTSIKITGIVNGEYDWQVIGCSGNSVDTAKGYFSTSAISTCSTPTNFSTNNITSNSATLHWVSPASPGLTKFVVQYDSINGNSWTTIDNILIDSVNLTGLLSGKSYKWQVKSVCGSSSSSYMLNLFTTESTIAACSLPSGLISGTITDTTSRISWNTTSGATRYGIQYRRAYTATWSNAISFTNSFVISGLKPGTTIEWRVRAVCSLGNGAYVSGIPFTTTGTAICYSPTVLSSDSLTDSSAVLTWNPNGSTSYKIRYRLKNFINWSSAYYGPSPDSMLLVHDDSLIIPNSIGGYQVAFTGTPNSFTYNGNGIYVAYEYSHISTKRASTFGVAMCTFGDSIVKGSLGNDSLIYPLSFGSKKDDVFQDILSSTHFRPETRFGSSGLIDSVEVSNVYALGNHTTLYSNPETITALVKNHTSRKQSFTINLLIRNAASGMVKMTNSQTTDSIPANSNLLFSFSGWAPSMNEKDSIIVSISPLSGETSVLNNSAFFIQNVNDNIISYDDATPNYSSAGFDTLSGMLLSKYKMSGCGSVNSAQVFLNPSAKGHSIYGVILNSSGAILDTSFHFTPDTIDLNKYHSFYFPTIPAFTNSDYYIGLVQTKDSVNGYRPVGIQWEGIDIRSNTFYKADSSGTNLVAFNLQGRLMIRAEVLPSVPTVTITGKLSLCPSATNILTASNISTRYANKIIDYSSAKTGYSAIQTLGIPNVYPANTISNNNWISETPDGQREFLTVGFSNPAPVNFVDIYETYGAGAIDTVYVKNGSGNYDVVYSGTAAFVPNARINHISFPLTTYNVSEIRVAINSSAVIGYNAIDAISTGWIDNPSYTPSSYLWSTGETTKSISVSTSGNLTVVVTDPSTCPVSAKATVDTISVVNPVISADRATTFCVGDTAVKLTSSKLTGNVWSPGGATTQTISANASGSYTVTNTDPNGCGVLSSAPTIVTVNPLPVVAITGSLAFCPGGSTTLYAGTGYTSYSWSTGQTSDSIIVNTANSYTVNVVSTLGCKGKKTVVSSVSTVPTPSISGNNNFCPGNSITLDAGNGFSSYNWSTGATTQTILVTSAGTFSVTVTNGAGCSGTASVTSHLYTPPSPLISGASSFCQGSSVNLTASVGYNSYSWSPGSSTLQSVTANTAATYSVTVTDGNGCSGTASRTTSFFPTPSPAISGNLSFCNGGNTLLDAGLSFASYAWSSGPTTHSITVSTVGTFSVTVTDNNGCVGSSSVTTTFNANTPAIPGIISGQNKGLCNASTKTFTIASVPLATTYLWTVPAGDSILSGQGTTSINVRFNSFTVASISVVASNTCGQSPVRTQQVDGPPALVGAISGAIDGVCRINGVPYSIVPLDGVTSYTWTAPVGATIASGQGTPSILINYGIGFSSGNVCVTAANSCGSNSGCLAVTSISAIPLSITGPTGVCKKAQNVNYSTALVSGATSYTWNVPPGAKIVTGQGTNSISVTFANTAGAISVKANNTCGSSLNRSIAVGFTCREIEGDQDQNLFNEATAYPNPTSGKLTVSFNSTTSGKYILRVTDLLGKIMLINTGVVQDGLNTQELDLGNVAKGMYLLSFEREGSKIKTMKIVVN